MTGDVIHPFGAEMMPREIDLVLVPSSLKNWDLALKFQSNCDRYVRGMIQPWTGAIHLALARGSRKNAIALIQP
ncbi:MAG TPA: hypothetical protein V6D16_15510 [Candidatus Obscuribacterales bacterium]